MNRITIASLMQNPGALAVLDTETTGLNGHVIELGIVDGHGRTLVDRRFNPGHPIHPRATEVHGITDEDLAGLPSLAEVWESEVAPLLLGRILVIYNAEFDLGCLARSGAPRLRAVCAMQLYAREARLRKWCKLTTACEREGVTFEGQAHSALADARATLALLQARAALVRS